MNSETNRRDFLKQVSSTVGVLSLGSAGALSLCGCGTASEAGPLILPPVVAPPALKPKEAVKAIQTANIAPITSVTTTVQKTLTATDVATTVAFLAEDPAKIVLPVLDANGKIVSAQTAASLGVPKAELLAFFNHLGVAPQTGDTLVNNTYTVNGASYTTLALSDSQGRIKFDPFIGLLPPNPNVPGSIQQNKVTQGIQNIVGMSTFNPVTGAPVFKLTVDVVRNLDANGQPLKGDKALTVSNIQTVLGPNMMIHTAPTVTFHNKSADLTRGAVICQILEIVTEVCNVVADIVGFFDFLLSLLYKLLCTLLRVVTDICVFIDDNSGVIGH